MKFRFQLDSASGVPYYKQIVDYIVFAVSNGTLKRGEQLPTVRQAAVDLQVNLNTVSKAYNELEHKGLVTTQQGTGTFISHDFTQPNQSEKTAMLKKMCSSFLSEVSALGVTSTEILEILNETIANYKSADAKRGKK